MCSIGMSELEGTTDMKEETDALSFKTHVGLHIYSLANPGLEPKPLDPSLLL